MGVTNDQPVKPYNIQGQNSYSVGNDSSNPVRSKEIPVQWSRKDALSAQELNELGIGIQALPTDNSANHYEHYESSTRKVLTEGPNRRLSEVVLQRPSTAFFTSKSEKRNQEDYIRDLEEVGKLVGFRVVLTDQGKKLDPVSKYIYDQPYPWLEDMNLVSGAGHTIGPQYSNVPYCNPERNLEESLDTRFRYDVNKDCAIKLVTNGGNVLTTQDSNGRTKVFINEHRLNGIVRVQKEDGASVDINEIKRHAAEILGVDESDIIYLNLPDDHIDMHLRPGPNGVMFMNDFNLSANMIDAVLSNPKYSSKLSIEERQTLKAFKTDAIKMKAEKGAVYKEMKTRIKASGFDVVSLPGVFSNGEAEDKISVNFMNGIMGTGNKGTYFISNGSNVKILNNIFASTLSNYGIDNVYFVGRNSNKINFNSSNESIEARGGIDCRAIEIGRGISPLMR